jgi:murein DD-endopeptidase MepM/ murein hydrolase activator NlpD
MNLPRRLAIALVVLALCVPVATVLPAGDGYAQMRGDSRGRGGPNRGREPAGGPARGSAAESRDPAPDEGTETALPPEIARAFGPTRATDAHMDARGLFATGLEPVYPVEATCPRVTSPFGATERSDGSRRSRRFFAGRHSGTDIPADEGTPVLAIADGTVVHLSGGQAGGIGGIGLVLQHAPADTGLPVWTYTEYKHLRELPDLAPGARVRMGQPIGAAGTTGTTGGHYGEDGFSHLHLGAYFSESPGFVTRPIFAPDAGQWLDAIALFRGGPPFDSASLRALAATERRVAIPYRTTDGADVPAGTRLVWPFACARDEG